MRGYRDSKLNRDRREDSFARSIIARAEQIRREVIQRLATEKNITYVTKEAGEVINRDPMDTGLCCMARHANAVAPWSCDCPCHTRVEAPLGECTHCGSAYHTSSEQQYHADAECVGGVERFR